MNIFFIKYRTKHNVLNIIESVDKSVFSKGSISFLKINIYHSNAKKATVAQIKNCIHFNANELYDTSHQTLVIKMKVCSIDIWSCPLVSVHLRL